MSRQAGGVVFCPRGVYTQQRRPFDASRGAGSNLSHRQPGRFKYKRHDIAYNSIADPRTAANVCRKRFGLHNGCNVECQQCRKDRPDRTVHGCESRYWNRHRNLGGGSDKIGTASVTVAAVPPTGGIAVMVSPASMIVSMGGKQQFTANVTGSTAGVTWTATGAVGTVDTRGCSPQPRLVRA